MQIAEMNTADILVLWSETCQARKQGSWMTYHIDTAIIEKCIKVLESRGHFAAKAAEEAKFHAPKRGADGHLIEVD